MNPHIFREYDIRGIADRDLTDDVVRAVEDEDACDQNSEKVDAEQLVH